MIVNGKYRGVCLLLSRVVDYYRLSLSSKKLVFVGPLFPVAFVYFFLT